MLSSNVSWKKGCENYVQFFKYKQIKFRPNEDTIENEYDGLTEEDDLVELWDEYKGYLKIYYTWYGKQTI